MFVLDSEVFYRIYWCWFGCLACFHIILDCWSGWFTSPPRLSDAEMTHNLAIVLKENFIFLHLQCHLAYSSLLFIGLPCGLCTVHGLTRAQSLNFAWYALCLINHFFHLILLYVQHTYSSIVES